MATKTKRKEPKLIVTNYDKNGNIIEDISKLVVPKEWQIELLNEINRGRGIESR